MEQNVRIHVEKQLKKQHRTKLRNRIVHVLGSIVVFCTTYALILPAITMSGTAYCGFEEHTHADSCYKTELICELSTETTQPSEHSHLDTCYEIQNILECTLAESTGHTHSESCVAETQTLNCEIAEDETHAHGEECYVIEAAYACGVEVSEGHTHEEGCYTSAEVLICENTESSAEVEHVHIEECYEKVMSCEMEEHTHKLACFSNPAADVETPEKWEGTLPGELSGDVRKDVLAVAKSQLGYKESANNYIVVDEDTKKGYSRYGDWYGAPYGDWCAMFVSFCLDYANVDGFPLDANCQQWINKLSLEKYDLYREADSYVPKEGDLIFFDWDKDGVSQHVGLVSEVTLTADGTVDQIRTIEGNTGKDVVEYVTYNGDNTSIMGYGILEVTDVQGESGLKLSYENEEMKLTVSFPEEYELPENAELDVKIFDAEADEQTFAAIAEAVDESITDESQRVGSLDILDIQVLVDGEAYEIPEDLKLEVLIEYAEPRYDLEEVRYINDFKVVSIEKAASEMQTYALRTGAADYIVTENEAVFEEVEKGVTSISLTTFGLRALGIAVTNEVKTGDFWKRVDSFSELSVNDTILLVSIEGNIALTYDNSNNGVTVALNQVKGNPGYYDIVQNFSGDALTNKSKFTIKALGSNTVQLSNVGTTNARVKLSNGNVFSTSGSYSLTLENIEEETTEVEKHNFYTWRIKNDSYYLSYTATNKLTSSSSSSIKNDKRGFLIFKLEEATLTIPGDTENEYVPPVIPDEPVYDNVAPTGSRQGEETNIQELENLVVQYASDPATSDIEDRFIGDGSEDGKLLTDKSVIYEGDDYGAFDTYDDGIFGVTLSALGQVPSVNLGIGPAMDVVIILDTSYSMLNTSYATTNGQVRMQWAMEALNDVIGQIMAEDLNRVGVVTFSDAAQTVLPLDRYTTTGGQYLKLTKDSKSYNHARGTTLYDLDVSENLRNSNGQSVNFDLDYGDDRPNWEGTFTQTGIQQAAEILLANDDTKDAFGNARLPVIIMISDGGPTLCTSNYKSPNDGPVYGNSGNPSGDGTSDYDTSLVKESSGNHYGVNGYYTVLTANYFKNLVGSHYDMTAKYVSVGIGIAATDSQSTAVHDNAYCRAVLKPSEEFLQTALNASGYASYEAGQLDDLLNNDYSSQFVAIPNHYNGFNQLSVTHSLVPVVENPYKSYDYADAYMDGAQDNLADILIEYLQTIQFSTYDWNYVLENQTSVEMQDPIGAGMEVKGEPVLIFGHAWDATKNDEGAGVYLPTGSETINGVTTYYYDYKVPHDIAYPLNADADSKVETQDMVYDLNNIQVTVTTTGEGLEKLQTVSIVFPDDLLPLMYAEKYGQFYYQEHPMRLSYQVGLTEAALEDAAGIGYGESRVYYTNQWDESGNPTTTARFVKNDSNAYKFNSLEDVNKKTNVTETIETSFKSAEDGGNVTQQLGNNGKLTIMNEPTSVNVEKVWVGTPGESVQVNLLADGKIYGEPVVLSAENNWKHSWKMLPKKNADGKNIEYKVSEEYVPGYNTSIDFVPAGSEYSVTAWTEANSFTKDGEYVFVSKSTGAALGKTNNNRFQWVNDINLSSNAKVDNLVVWVANSTGNSSKLKNKGTSNYIRGHSEFSYSSWPYEYYWSAGGSSSSDYTTITFDAGKLSFTGIVTKYYLNGIDDSSYGIASASASHEFVMYHLDTQTKKLEEDTWIITNTETEEEPIEFTLKKAGPSDIVLEGAKFDLYVEDENGVSIPGMEGTKGTLIFHEKATGQNGEIAVKIPATDATYYLVEIEAPTGYNLLTKPIVIHVTNGKLTIEETEMAKLEDKKEGIILKVVNTPGYVLPETGGIGTTGLQLGGVLLLLASILMLIKKILERRYYKTHF